MRPSQSCTLLLVLTLACAPAIARAQGGPPGPPPEPPPAAAPQLPLMVCCTVAAPTLRLFVDCGRCDQDYLVTNVSFVDYVRDRTVADLHVLVTTQTTGGGGTEWTMKLIGRGRLQGEDRTVTFDTAQTASDDDMRREFARVLKLALVDYVASTSAFPQLDVTWKKPALPAQTTPTKDPWNYWLFRIGTNGNFNGQESSVFKYYNGSVSANRTTNAWKIGLNANTNQNSSTFHLDDGSTVKSATNSWSFNTLVVKSVGPHWSLGGLGAVSHSSYSNQARLYKAAPAVEYDVFPYKDSTRRMLTVLYQIDVSRYDYSSITIFDKLHEIIPEHQVAVGLSLKESWGSISTSTNFTQQLTNLPRYRVDVNGEADVRLFKGFSFNIFGDYSKIRNQFYLPRGEASTEDVLLQIRQLATGYSYFVGFGVSYSFGSIFNNIVNPRFGGM